MKLSCLPVSLYPALGTGQLSLGDWFRKAARLGLDGADLSVAHLPSRQPAFLRPLVREAEEAGVAVPMLVTYSDFTHPDRRHRSWQADELRAWIDVAAQLNVTFVRVTAGQAHAGVAEADGLLWAAEGLTVCLKEARSAGVRLLYENHTRGWTWECNDFTQPTARFLAVVERTRESGLEVLFDTANSLVLHDDPSAVLDRVFDRVGAVHLSDIAQRGVFAPTVIGTGVAPLHPLLHRLRSGGFDGWISIEEASRTGERGFRAAVEFADRAWTTVGGTPRGRSRRS